MAESEVRVTRADLDRIAASEKMVKATLIIVSVMGGLMLIMAAHTMVMSGPRKGGMDRGGIRKMQQFQHRIPMGAVDGGEPQMIAPDKGSQPQPAGPQGQTQSLDQLDSSSDEASLL